MKLHPLWAILWNLTSDHKMKWFCKLFWNTKIMQFPNEEAITTKELWNNRP